MLFKPILNARVSTIFSKNLEFRPRQLTLFRVIGLLTRQTVQNGPQSAQFCAKPTVLGKIALTKLRSLVVYLYSSHLFWAIFWLHRNSIPQVNTPPLGRFDHRRAQPFKHVNRTSLARNCALWWIDLFGRFNHHRTTGNHSWHMHPNPLKHGCRFHPNSLT